MEKCRPKLISFIPVFVKGGVDDTSFWWLAGFLKHQHKDWLDQQHESKIHLQNGKLSHVKSGTSKGLGADPDLLDKKL